MRRDGMTTQQMLEAPLGAVFVWVNSRTGYARDLAIYLDRRDLVIVAPERLDGDRWLGQKLTGLVIDHAADLTNRQYDVLPHVRQRIRPQGDPA